MMKKEVTEKQWLENIKKAREVMGARSMHQMRIAELALSVCEITWGGRAQEGKYTLSRFASEIGVEAKTLSNWVATKKQVLDKLPLEIKNKLSYTDLAILAKRTKSKSTREEVEAIASDYLSMDTYNIKITRYLTHLRSLAHNFEKKDAVFKCEENVLEEAFHYCSVILKTIRKDRKHLKAKNNDLARSVNVRSLSSARAVLGDRV